jgi:hypothetical protein
VGLDVTSQGFSLKALSAFVSVSTGIEYNLFTFHSSFIIQAKDVKHVILMEYLIQIQ